MQFNLNANAIKLWSYMYQRGV